MNISIYMVRDAIRKKFDKAILITNDTDIVPAVKMARNENRQLEFKLLTPPKMSTHDALFNEVKPGSASKLTEQHIKTSLLPEKIIKTNGKVVLAPAPYKQKKSD